MPQYKNKVDKRISTILIRAKKCSDRGHSTGCYAGKDELIKEAISLINKCFKYTSWRYYISHDVVYFDTKLLDGNRFQISFHYFTNLGRVGSGRQTTWTGSRGTTKSSVADRKVTFYQNLDSLRGH